MKKLFFTIYFTVCFCNFYQAKAAVSTFEEAMAENQEAKPIVSTLPDGLPDPDNVAEVREFFKKRFETAVISDAADLGDLNKSNAMDVQHSAEYIENLKEQKKSIFEKIYDHLVGHLDEKEAHFSPDTVFYEQIKPNSAQKGQAAPNVPVVQVKLPNGIEIIAPAREHIPYLLASYQILPTGTIDVEEDVVVIANGRHLKNGLTKSMPKFSTSRSGVKKKIELTLLSVSLNGKEIDYKLQEIGNNVLFVPKEKYELESGIYTYHFHYLLDRKLWYYDTFTEFYVDLTSPYDNLVTGSANAIISVPDGRTFLSQLALAGKVGHLSAERTVIAQLSSNALGFASVEPLASDESMHILVSLDKNIFTVPNLGKRFVWFVTDYGDILFALLGLLIIFTSYYLSWKWIKENKSRLNIRFRQTAPLNRYILNGVYDKRSFVSALLELVHYKTIDIKKEGTTYYLIKQTDVLKNLPKSLKMLMKMLFSKMDTSLDISAKNKLKIDRAFNAHKSYIQTYLKLLAFRMNVYYLAFSLGMLFLTFYAISYIALNPLETIMILTFSSLTIAFYLWILRYPFANKWLRYVLRTIAILFVVFTVLIISVYVHLLTALLLTTTIEVMIEYSLRFSTKNGLIKTKTRDISNLYQYLKTNVQGISLRKEFEVQQANIFAFELEEQYKPYAAQNDFFRLDIADELMNAF